MGSVSIGKFINSIIRDYDHNNNGVIDLKDNGLDESSFDTRKVIDEPDRTIYETRRYYFDNFMRAADVNKDNKVTKEEMTNLVKKYDRNNDGKLNWRSAWDAITGKPKGDLEVFDRDYPERYRILHRHVVPKPGHPNHPYPLKHDMENLGVPLDPKLRPDHQEGNETFYA